MIIDYDQKRLLRNVIENSLFNGLIEDIRAELAIKMLETDDVKVRESLYNENKALTSIVGRLTAIANELRMKETDAA